HLADLPRGLRTVLKAMGAGGASGGGNLASYLMFEAAYCKELIQYGYSDAMLEADHIRQFFSLQN
ncbi:MAG: hypothetical protein KJO62_01060, partial [Gammaproteobacteria bacterium]|nr:hypothetical protein [Gammaproteobacteria bacterium]